MLAFLERGTQVLIYIYRGFEGFVLYKRIELPSAGGRVHQMTALTVPSKTNYKCDQHYLVVRKEVELLFYGIRISGCCGIRDVQCDVY